MTISQKLYLPEIPQLQAKEVMKLVKSSEEASPPPPLVQTTQLRNLDEIFLDLEKGTPERVNRLEWVYCLYAKAQWDSQHPDRSRATSQAIWKAARQNSWLKQRLFWRLSLFYSGSDSKILAPSLAESFIGFTSNTEAENFVVKIINAIKDNQPQQIAHFSWTNLLSPQQLLESFQLPTKIPITELALNFVAQYFTKAVTVQVKQITWLLFCFTQMTRKQQVSTSRVSTR